MPGIEAKDQPKDPEREQAGHPGRERLRPPDETERRSSDAVRASA